MADARRTLVTGGAGFIGAELVTQLVGLGHDVVVLDNLVAGRWENLDGLSLPPGAKVEGDVRDTALLRHVLAGVASVFHLACRGLRFGLHSPFETHDVNATGTLRLLEVARAANVARFVHVSSSEVYGNSQQMPLAETSATLPTTAYGASKLAGEAYARAFHRSYGVPVTIVRPFNSFGPRAHHEGDAGEVIPKFVLRALAGQPLVVFGDGSQTRDFTWVSDTARGIAQAAAADDAVGETVNLGSGRETSIRSLAKIVLATAGRGEEAVRCAAPRPGDLPRLRADTDKARRLLAFCPTVSLEEGIARLVAAAGRDPAAAAAALHADVERNWERVHG
jgi:UDP-glucose 4-epimerase